MLLLHRDPLEVLVANAGHLPEALIPGSIPPDVLGPAPRPLADVEDFAAFVQSRYFARAADLSGRPGVRTLDYAQFATSLEPALCAHFRLSGAEVRIALAAALPLDAKECSRIRAFTPDAAEKQAAATEAQRAWVKDCFAQAWARLQEASHRSPEAE